MTWYSLWPFTLIPQHLPKKQVVTRKRRKRGDNNKSKSKVALHAGSVSDNRMASPVLGEAFHDNSDGQRPLSFRAASTELKLALGCRLKLLYMRETASCMSS